MSKTLKYITIGFIACIVVLGFYVLKSRVDKSMAFESGTTVSSQIVAGKPVKWVAVVSKEDLKNGKQFLQLPGFAENIVAKPATEQEKTVALNNLNKQAVQKDLLALANNNSNYTAGLISSTQNLSAEILNWLKDLLDFNVMVKGQNKFYNISGVKTKSDYVTVTYETPAPRITEKTIKNGKEITVSSPAGVSYKDVLAYANLSGTINQKEVQILWKNNKNQKMVFDGYNLSGAISKKASHVEWTVPHLSEQVFDIIYISKASLLDKNKQIIKDIYDAVETKDGNFATITQDNYVRVTFNKILNNRNDITVYAKSTDYNLHASLEVYPVYTDNNGNQTEGAQLITVSDGTNLDFSNINSDGKYRILLKNLQTPTDIFDLKVSGSVDIDYIVDPGTTYYWTGGVTDSNTSNAYNWSLAAGACSANSGNAVLPGVNDDIHFGGTGKCQNSATVNSALSVNAFYNDSAYSGTVTLNAALTVAAGLTLSAGTLDVSASGCAGSTSCAISVGGAWNNSAGTFTYRTGTVTFTGTSSITDSRTTFYDFATASSATFTTSADITLMHGFTNGSSSTFTASSGTVTFNPQTAAPIFTNSGSTVSFYNFTTTGAVGSMTTSANITITHNFTSSGPFDLTWNSGAVTFTGTTSMTQSVNYDSFYDVTISSGTFTAPSIMGFTHTLSNSGSFSASTGTVVCSGTCSLSGTSPSFYGLTILTTNTLSVTGSLTVTGTFTANSSTVYFSGSSSVSTGKTFYNLTILSGTFTAPAAMTISNAFTNNGTFSSNAGAVTFNTTASINGSTVTSFYTINDTNLTLNQSITVTNSFACGGPFSPNTYTVTFAGTTSISGGSNPSFYNLTISSGTLTASGNFTFTHTFTRNATFTPSTSTVTVGGIASLAGSSLPSFYNLTISGSNSLSVPGYLTVSNTFTANTSTVNFSGTSGVMNLGLTFYNLTISSGTFTAPSSMTITNVFTNNGTFTPGTNTVTFNGLASIAGSTLPTFYNLTITGSTSLTVPGTLTVSHTFTYNTSTVYFNGSSSATSGLTFYSLSVSSGTFTAPSAITITATLSVGGTFAATTSTVTFTGTTAITGAGAVNISNFTISSGTFTAPSAMIVSGTFTNNGTFNHNSGTVTFSPVPSGSITGSSTTIFNNLTISSGTLVAPPAFSIAGTFTNNGSFTAGTGTATFSGTASIAGSSATTFKNLTIYSGTLTGTSGTMNISGNWNNSGGSFIPNLGTVVFNGSSQAISGANTFYNLTAITPDQVIIFPQASTTTISGTLTLEGTNGHNILLKSDESGTDGAKAHRAQVNINAVSDNHSHAYFQYVTPYDNNASESGAQPIQNQNCTNGGHNLGWNFGGGSAKMSVKGAINIKSQVNVKN